MMSAQVAFIPHVGQARQPRAFQGGQVLFLPGQDSRASGEAAPMWRHVRGADHHQRCRQSAMTLCVETAPFRVNCQEACFWMGFPANHEAPTYRHAPLPYAASVSGRWLFWCLERALARGLSQHSGVLRALGEYCEGEDPRACHDTCGGRLAQGNRLQ